jgi:hypothetical protein
MRFLLARKGSTPFSAVAQDILLLPRVPLHDELAAVK